MSEPLLWPPGGTRQRVAGDARLAVVGGGIAGIAAATVLAERGARVTLFERAPALGGRAGAWPETLATGETVEMERGFHAFFRQYYNLRRLLRRVDPHLSCLAPADDYPILGPDGAAESFRGLPRRAPLNLLALTARTRTLRWRDLLGINGRAALEMLAFDAERTYRRHDDTSAGAYLDSLRFPPEARQMLFSVFSHSFFNAEDEMSAAELLMMFHCYFFANPEGLVFDVCTRPLGAALWQPFAAHLRALGVDLRLGAAATRIERGAERAWRVEGTGGAVEVDGAVLALSVPALQALVAASPDLDDRGWRADVASLEVTRPFAVWRLWLDRPTRPGRAPFAGTTGFGLLDNISLYHLFEDESRSWAAAHGGAVVELHAYAVDPALSRPAIERELLAGLHALYPETAGAAILDQRFLLEQDCPGFAPGSRDRRPGVATPWSGISLAGDFVALPLPSALMERAATSGMLAANRLLAPRGVRPEPVYAVPRRGLLAGLPPRPRPPWRRGEAVL